MLNISESYCHSSSINKLTPLEEAKRKEKMSFALGIKTFNKIILASDSRSVILNQNHIITSFSDHFQKMVYIPKENMSFVCTGINILNNYSITDFIKNFSFEPKNPEENFINLVNTIQKYLTNNNLVNICCGYYINNIPHLKYADIINSESKIYEADFLWHINSHIIPALYIEKDKINNTLRSKIAFPDFDSAIKFSKSIVKSEITYSKYNEDVLDTVGGKVQILAMNENGLIYTENLPERGT